MQAIMKGSRIRAKILTAILSIAMIFTMIPLTGGTAYADDADRVVFTIVDTDGTSNAYTKAQMESKFVKITDPVVVGKETIVEGFAVKNVLKNFNQDDVVTVATVDGYDSNTVGKTVSELRSAGYILAYKIIDKNGKEQTLWDSVDSGGRVYDFYLYDPSGTIKKDKEVNKFTLTASGTEPSTDPTQTTEPPEQIADLTITGDAVKAKKEFSIKELKNNNDITKYRDIPYPSLNNSGKYETSVVSGVYLEDLINYVGIKSGMEVEKVEAIPYLKDGVTLDDPKFIKTYTWDTITKTDINGHKAMFIWGELEQEDAEAGATEQAKVQRTIRGQFASDDVNRADWGKNIKKIIVYGKEKTTQSTSTTQPTTKSQQKPKPAAKKVVTAPKIVTQAKSKKKSMVVSWNKGKDIASYKVMYRKAGSSKWSTETTTGTNLTVKGLNAGKKYAFKVVAVGKNGSMKESAISYRYFQTTKKVSAKGKKKAIKVTWKKNKKASGQEVFYSLDKNMKNSKSIKVKGKKKSCKIKGLEKGKTYYVRVRPYVEKNGTTYTGILGKIKVVKVK